MDERVFVTQPPATGPELEHCVRFAQLRDGATFALNDHSAPYYELVAVLGGRERASRRRDTRSERQRNTVERDIGRLKRYRAVSTRYDELAVRYEVTIQVAIIVDWKPIS